MSDSLNDTVIVIARVLTISTRPELLDEEELLLEPLRLPAVVLEPELADEAFELELEFELELPDETLSPGDTSATLTTVPVAGA
jgi:hypothetical protein